jgi:hypothetical protein
MHDRVLYRLTWLAAVGTRVGLWLGGAAGAGRPAGRRRPGGRRLSVLVVPLVAELAEPGGLPGVVLLRLEQRLGRSWLASAIVVAVWTAEHACYPLLASGGGLDLVEPRQRLEDANWPTPSPRNRTYRWSGGHVRRR